MMIARIFPPDMNQACIIPAGQCAGKGIRHGAWTSPLIFGITRNVGITRNALSNRVSGRVSGNS
jgi:hypothetical protein